MRAEVRELVENLSEVFKSIHHRSYHTMENKNIYPGQAKVLSLIKAHEGITQKDLSKMTFVTPASITGMLTKLEANHYLYRVPDQEDKRIMRVYLTPEGHKLAEKGEFFMMNMIDQAFEGFNNEELHTFLTLTQKLRNNLCSKEKHNS